MPRLRSRIQFLCALLLSATIFTANAGGDFVHGRNFIEDEELDETWINFGVHSKHVDENEAVQDFNDSNIGLGVEHRFSSIYAYTIGYYKNSLYRPSHYAGIYCQPIQLGRARLGAVVGVMDGYPAMNNGKYFLAAIPTISFEYQKLGVNILIIPPTPQVVGAVSFQFKLALE
ncbi:MAG: hypothetical protein PHP57_02585 [Sideroxydans sp.]|nr:hypothetical protein [Sideroxydans sp.]